MNALAVRLSKPTETPDGCPISVGDLRFCKSNKAVLTPRGTHTLVHLFEASEFSLTPRWITEKISVGKPIAQIFLYFDVAGADNSGKSGYPF